MQNKLISFLHPTESSKFKSNEKEFLDPLSLAIQYSGCKSNKSTNNGAIIFFARLSRRLPSPKRKTKRTGRVAIAIFTIAQSYGNQIETNYGEVATRFTVAHFGANY